MNTNKQKCFPDLPVICVFERMAKYGIFSMKRILFMWHLHHYHLRRGGCGHWPLDAYLNPPFLNAAL